ncbi:MAG: Cu(I)-responsive transcriptional regulator [Acetobacteraceae bacterium]|nr:Cu(I)-responsive transcriptional regulator [Acetobacteraceae bacterium]
MTIGQAARASSVSAKMIRYYEGIGLMPRAGRTGAGYRLYTEADVNTLRFIHRARAFGFSIERIRTLVALWQGGQPSRAVKAVALAHVAELGQRIAELTAMRDALQDLADACHGDNRPECPILRDLESHAASAGFARNGFGTKPRA